MDDEIRKKMRIKELEKELRVLRGSDGSASIFTETGEYQGHPIITVHGPFRPFSLGLKKAQAVLEVLEDIRAFVKSQDR